MSLAREQLTDAVTFAPGDCLDVLPTLPENSIDSCVTDPPYHLTSIVKRFGADNAAPAKDYSEERDNATGAYARASAGFMGKKWDGGDIAFRVATWRAIYRVLKPGGHLIAFGGTRTYHRMACAIEDAGFEIRDQLAWIYGSGFPKSHDVSKGIDRAAGAKGEFGAKKPNIHSRGDHVLHEGWRRPWMEDPEAVNNSGREYIPATEAAARWSGWGTALKPAQEPIVLARKPLSEPTVAANVLRWGTGALNVDGCRVAIDNAEREIVDNRSGANSQPDDGTIYGRGLGNRLQGTTYKSHSTGRWPANLIHDGSEEVVKAFPETKSGKLEPHHKRGEQVNVYGVSNGAKPSREFGGDEGSAARFFYTSKADADDRLGSKHPTVKPVDLMQWLVRLVTKKGGATLDPFAGTGTTGEAAWREGCKAFLIEREEEYQADIRRRMKLVFAGRDERVRESFKVAGKIQSHETLPLFRGGS